MDAWDFSDDEVGFFIVAGIAGAVFVVRWYLTIGRGSPFRSIASIRTMLATIPIASLAALWWVLNHWADPFTVAGHIDYELMMLAGGAASLGIAWFILPIMGISVRDDAIERGNPAAGVTAGGALLGAMAIFAGGNVGCGPTIWTTILPAVVAMGIWWAVWFIVAIAGHPTEMITIDRDLSAGLRQGAFLLASGLILGRAIAGDWISWVNTWSDAARLGWPVVFLALATIVMHRMFRPTPQQPIVPNGFYGIVAGAALLLTSIGYVLALGPADIGKHVISYHQYIGE